MLFPSEVFLLWFLPVVLGLYYLCRPRWRNGFLLLASYVFYAWWNPFSLLLMIGATVINYAGGALIGRAPPRRRHALLMLFVMIDVLLLGFFKYEGMLTRTVNAIAGRGILPMLNILLPIGISFYIFEGISYCVDCSQGKARARSFTEFACYLSLFPHVLAGPIIRFHELSDQLRSRSHSWNLAAEGVYRFLLGIAKEVLIADTMSVLADRTFTGMPVPAMIAWIGLIAYTLQIYFDFSGYSDMAIGLGLLFGFRFPENFDLPYFSKSITEFWRRWHRTLSSWFRDYVYIPLGGNRGGALLTFRNLFLTMLLAGFWHGANWTFVAWGGYYGILLGIERLLAPAKILERLPSVVRWALTLFLVMMGWVLFRSASFARAIVFYRSLFGFAPSAPFPHSLTLIALSIGIAAFLGERVISQRPRASVLLALGCSSVFLLCLVFVLGNHASPFIYFQF